MKKILFWVTFPLAACLVITFGLLEVLCQKVLQVLYEYEWWCFK